MTTQEEKIREQQRDTWNKFSDGWKKHDKLVIDWLRPVGERLIAEAQIRSGYLVLDAATGTGEPGLTVAGRVGAGKVIGSDVAADMLKIAESKAHSAGIRNYEVKACNDSALPFPSDYFDAAVCRFGVMYFPDPAVSVKELVRVVKRGRKVALSAWAEPSKNSWATTASSIVNQTLGITPPPGDAPGIFRFATEGTLKALLGNAGLRMTDASEVKGELIFSSADRYWEFITDVIAPVATALNKATPEQRNEIKLAVVEAANSKGSNGALSFGWSAWVVSGLK